MRAKDYIEIHKSEMFHDDLLQVINDLLPYRKDYEYTEAYFKKNLIEDIKGIYIIADFKDNVFDPDEDLSKAPHIQPPLSFDHKLYSDFRDELYNAVIKDISFGYLLFLSIRVNDKIDFYGEYDIDLREWYPDDNIIEQAIFNYQDELPAPILDKYLLFNDVNYDFYSSNKKSTDSNDFWLSIFITSYTLFENIRPFLNRPLTALDIVKEFITENTSNKIHAIKHCSLLLSNFNFDISKEQIKGKNILVQEIVNYANQINKELYLVNLPSVIENKANSIQTNNELSNLATNSKPKTRTILDEKREIYELSNNPEYLAAIEEHRRSQFRKLTDKDIELVTNDCNTLNEVYLKGLDIFESYFLTNQIYTEDIEYLQTLPFSGLLSDNYFDASVLSNFDDPIVIGTIFDICFADTIYRIQNLDFTFSTIPDINNEPRLNELIRHILKNKNNSVLIKDTLICFAKEIRELIHLVYIYSGNKSYLKNVNLNAISYSNSFFDDKFEDINSEVSPYSEDQDYVISDEIDFGITDFFNLFKHKSENKELFLVDKLEITLAFWAILFKREWDNDYYEFDFNSSFFNDFIQNELQTIFKKELHDYIRPLNNIEINRFFSISLDLFKSNTPEKRIQTFYRMFHEINWYPSFKEYLELNIFDKQYADHIWKQYSIHFHLFIKETQSVYEIFKASLTSRESSYIVNEQNNSILPLPTKLEKLKNDLKEYGFLSLPKIKTISPENQSILFEKMNSNGIPYTIAMFDFLGLLKHLSKEHSMTKSKINDTIGFWLGIAPRAIKGNINVLDDYSNEDKNRYTSHLHKENVLNDYNQLK